MYFILLNPSFLLVLVLLVVWAIVPLTLYCELFFYDYLIDWLGCCHTNMNSKTLLAS